jgi:signal peptidase
VPVKRLFALLLLSCALAAVGGAVMLWQDGYRVYAVRTGSMSPTYPTGSLVVAAPARGDVPQVGDVVTFRTQGGLVTHRVHGVDDAGVQTKGDANRTPDPWVLPPRNIVGQVMAGVADGGYLLVYLQQPTGIASLVLLALSVVFAWSLFFGDGTAGAAQVGRARVQTPSGHI